MISTLNPEIFYSVLYTLVASISPPSYPHVRSPPTQRVSSWQTWSDRVDLHIVVRRALRTPPHSPGWRTSASGAASLPTWPTPNWRRPLARRCARPTRPSRSPSPSWGRGAVCGRKGRSSRCPEICPVRCPPSAPAPTQRKFTSWSFLWLYSIN